MAHPLLVIGIVLLFGILDYGLTRVGYRWHLRYRHPVIEYERYEQNPLWNLAIHQTNRYDLRHLLVLGGMGLGLWFLLKWEPESASFEVTFFVSLILVTYVRILTAHLLSLRRSRYIGSSPGEVQGKLRYSYRATLKLGLMSDQMEFIPWFVLFLLLPHPVTLAAAASPLLIASTRAFWLQLHDLQVHRPKLYPLRMIWEGMIAVCHLIIVFGGALWLGNRFLGK